MSKEIEEGRTRNTISVVLFITAFIGIGLQSENNPMAKPYLIIWGIVAIIYSVYYILKTK